MAQWRKKGPQVRKSLYRRRYVEARVAQLAERSNIREGASVGLFQKMSRGEQVDLLEPLEQPEATSDETLAESSVSDPPEVAAAKHAAATMDRASASAVKAVGARAKADEDGKAVSEAKEKYDGIHAAALPFYTLNEGNSRDMHPKVSEAIEARAKLDEAERTALNSAEIAKTREQEAARDGDDAKAAVEEFNFRTGRPLAQNHGAEEVKAIRAAADAAIKAHREHKTRHDDCSASQLSRVAQQACATMRVYESLARRDREEEQIGRRALAATEFLGVDEGNETLLRALADMKTLRDTHSMPAVAGEVANRIGSVKAETVLLWFNQYDTLGYFKLDGRGSGCREWILTEDDLLHTLLTHLKTEKRLTVSKVVDYINNTLLTEKHTSMGDAKMKDVYGIVRPVSRGLVHSWLRRADCKFDRATQSYYTDGHNKPEVVASRLVYLAKLRRISLRQPVWVQMPLADLSEEAVKSIEHDGLRCEVYKYVHEGKEFIEFHVDRLGHRGEAQGKGRFTDEGAFDVVRLKSKYGGNFSVRFEAEARSPCRVNHKDVCKCHLHAWHMGQDECIFKAYLREGMEWVTAGVRGMRKKTEGPGIMVSVFQNEIRGFGFAMTGDELVRVNAFRSTQGRAPLKDTPGIRCLEYGKHKDGYWNYDMFAEQCVDIMDCFEVLYPDWQLVMEVDHSSGHAKYREDGLHVANMNMKWGGAKGSKMRSTTVTAEDCLGPNEAKIEWKDRIWDCKLKAGDVQSPIFQVGDPPPFYDIAAPAKSARKGRKVRVACAKSGRGRGQKYKQLDEPIVGYEGKPKGVRQMLWERGLWEDGMTGSAEPSSGLNANTVLGDCPDFREEKSALQHLVESRGHILIMSPKCHPELAGMGIEYSWGKAKLEFRRRTNDENPKKLEKNMLKALSTEAILTLQRIRRFARRTRDYRRTYALLGGVEADIDELKRKHDAEGYKLIEKMVATCKAHRNIVDMEVTFLSTA